MKTTFLAALVAAAIALPSFGQSNPAPTPAKLEASPAKVQATPKEGAKLARRRARRRRKPAKPRQGAG